MQYGTLTPRILYELGISCPKQGIGAALVLDGTPHRPYRVHRYQHT